MIDYQLPGEFCRPLVFKVNDPPYVTCAIRTFAHHDFEGHGNDKCVTFAVLYRRNVEFSNGSAIVRNGSAGSWDAIYKNLSEEHSDNLKEIKEARMKILGKVRMGLGVFMTEPF